LNGSYGTPKKNESAAPSCWRVILNSAIRMSSSSSLRLRAARCASSKIGGGDQALLDQVVVFGLGRALGALVAPEQDRHVLGEFDHRLLDHQRERQPVLGIDELHHAHQIARLRVGHRRGEHLHRAIPGAPVHLLQEAQLRAVALQLLVLVDVANVDELVREGHVAGDRVLADRQLQILERAQARLHARDDRGLVLAHQIDRDAIGAEDGGDLGAQAEQAVFQIAGRLDLGHQRREHALHALSRRVDPAHARDADARGAADLEAVGSRAHLGWVTVLEGGGTTRSTFD
jgi:hypothetical protein